MSNFLKTAQIDWEQLGKPNTNNSGQSLLSLTDQTIKSNVAALKDVEADENAKALAVSLAMIKASQDAQLPEGWMLGHTSEMERWCRDIFAGISVDKEARKVYFSKGIVNSFSKLCWKWGLAINDLKNGDTFELVSKLSESNAKTKYGVQLSSCNTKKDYENLTKEIFNTFRARELRSGLHSMKKGLGKLFTHEGMKSAAAKVGGAVKTTFSREGAENLKKGLGEIAGTVSKIPSGFSNPFKHHGFPDKVDTEKYVVGANLPASPNASSGANPISTDTKKSRFAFLHRNSSRKENAPKSDRASGKGKISLNDIQFDDLQAVKNLAVVNNSGLTSTVEQLWNLKDKDPVAKCLLLLTAMIGVTPANADHIVLDNYLRLILSTVTALIIDENTNKVYFSKDLTNDFNQVVKEWNNYYKNQKDADSVGVLKQLQLEGIVDGIASTTKKSLDGLCKEIHDVIKKRWEKNRSQRRKEAVKRGISKLKNAVPTGGVRYHGAGNLKKQTDPGVNNEKYRTIKGNATLKDSQVRLLKDFNKKYIKEWLEAGKVPQKNITDIFENEKTKEFNSLQDSLQKIFEHLSGVNNKTLLKDFINPFYDNIKDFRNKAVSMDTKKFGNATDLYTITHANEALGAYFSGMHKSLKQQRINVQMIVKAMGNFDQENFKPQEKNASENGFKWRTVDRVKFESWLSENEVLKPSMLGLTEYFEKTSFKDEKLKNDFELMRSSLNGKEDFPFDKVRRCANKLNDVVGTVLTPLNKGSGNFKKLALPGDSSLYKNMRIFMGEISRFYEIKSADRAPD